jgi:hypothetical protein
MEADIYSKKALEREMTYFQGGLKKKKEQKN